jgi:hypothetical protein
MVDTAHEVQRECQRLVEVDPERKLECEQRGSGAHRCVSVLIIPNPILINRYHAGFDMIGKRLYKPYTDLTNIVVCVSDGTPAGKEYDVSENAHLDSILPDAGAADDALSVGVMLECIRASRIHLLGHQLVLLCFVRCSIDVYNCHPRLTYCSGQSCRGIAPGRVPPIFHATSYCSHVSPSLPVFDSPTNQTSLQY